MARRKAFAVISPSSYYVDFVLRLVRRILILAAVLFVALAAVGGGLTYYVITRQNSQEAVTPQSYLLSSYIPLNFTDRSGGEHEGWLLLGLRRAPVIILSHGYDSNRSDLLSLGTILRDNHFNVYVFNFHGPKAKERYSDLGPRQAADLNSAIEAVTRQPGVNPNRIGLYGTSMGGYAALEAAQSNSKVKALVVDTTYATPEQMFDMQVDRLLGGSSKLFRVLTEAEFHLCTLGTKPPPILANPTRLEGMPKLFILGRDIPPLAEMTEGIYNQAPQPKQLLVMEHSLAGLTAVGEKKEYEDQVLNFFLQSLSLRAD
jgi:pimeloyl-ACP methyl ester carboxylesterase